MSTADIPLLATLPFLLIASAFFSGSETALFGLRHQELALLSRRGGIGASSTRSLLSNRRHLLITLLLGNMIANVLYFVITSVIVLRADSAFIGALFSIGSLLTIILLSEVAPKLIATANRVRWCSIFAPPMYIVHQALTVIRKPLSKFVVEPIARVIRPSTVTPRLSVDELGALLALSCEERVLGDDEAELLRAVTDLGIWRVDDVMTPRVDVQWLPESAGRDEVLAIVSESRVPAIPICAGTLDTGVEGVVQIDSYLLAGELGEAGPVGGHMSPPLFVPEQATLDRLLVLMKTRGEKFAVVVDEFGGVAGVITFSDIVRRLVGGASLRSDSDPSDMPARLEKDIQEISRGVWRVSGRLAANDWHNTFSEIGHTRAATIAGLVAQKLGRIPKEGDVTTFGNVRLEVETLRNGAIATIIVSLVTPADAEPETDA